MEVIKTVTGIAMLGFAATSFAAPVPLPAGETLLSDNNAEYLINKAGSAANDTTLDEGDRLRGIFTIDTVESLVSGSTDNTPFAGVELGGLFDITVTSKTSAGGNFFYTFAATGNLSTANAAVEMYWDPKQNFTRIGCGTTAACEATVLDGSLWAAFGFGANSFWTAVTTTDDIAVVGSIPAPTPGGSFNLGLDFLVNNTGFEFIPKVCFGPSGPAQNDVCASGSLLGKGNANTPYDSFSDVNFALNVVPVPATLGLLGLGLLGFAAATRRQKV